MPNNVGAISYQDFIEETVEAWTHRLIDQYQAQLAKTKTSASGDLKKIRGSVIRGAIRDGARLELYLRSYGRLLDMRGLSWSEKTPVENIIAWIREKGVQQFKAKYVQKYGRIPSSSQRFIRSLAWSIKLGKRKHRRRRWYAKTTWSSIYELYDEILIGLADPALFKLKNQIDGTTAG